MNRKVPPRHPPSEVSSRPLRLSHSSSLANLEYPSFESAQTRREETLVGLDIFKDAVEKNLGKVKEAVEHGLDKAQETINDKAGKDVVSNEHIAKVEDVINSKLDEVSQKLGDK